MPNQTRSQRQLQNLQLIREWHLQSSLNAHVEGRRKDAKYHMHQYTPLGKCPANAPCVVERREAPYPSSQSRTPTLREHFGNIHLLRCSAKSSAQLERDSRD